MSLYFRIFVCAYGLTFNLFLNYQKNFIHINICSAILRHTFEVCMCVCVCEFVFTQVTIKFCFCENCWKLSTVQTLQIVYTQTRPHIHIHYHTIFGSRCRCCWTAENNGKLLTFVCVGFCDQLSIVACHTTSDSLPASLLVLRQSHTIRIQIKFCRKFHKTFACHLPSVFLPSTLPFLSLIFNVILSLFYFHYYYFSLTLGTALHSFIVLLLAQLRFSLLVGYRVGKVLLLFPLLIWCQQMQVL